MDTAAHALWASLQRPGDAPPAVRSIDSPAEGAVVPAVPEPSEIALVAAALALSRRLRRRQG